MPEPQTARPDSAPLVEVSGLRKVFPGHGGEVVAVEDLSFTLPAGGTLAIVGESGAGKSTVARILMGFERATAGTIRVAGRERGGGRVGRAERLRRAREAQIVFQDPYSSLDPRQRADAAIDEVLRLHFDLTAEQRRARVAELIDAVGLDERQGRSLPRRLSGGQRQRVAIARALAVEPSLVVLDESVSALDVSIQAQILNLLAEIRERTGVAYLLISHDLAVVRHLTEHALVMQRGRVVEEGPTAQLLDAPRHPYTQQLRASVPARGWRPARTVRPLSGGQTA